MQVAVWEQLGRVTNGLSWCFSEPQGWMFEACNADQLERYVLPLMRGERHECYAITESGSGLRGRDRDDGAALPGRLPHRRREVVRDERQLRRLLRPAGALVDGEGGSHALFFVEADSPGIEIVRTPPFSHTYAAHHPTYRFNDVFVPDTRVR